MSSNLLDAQGNEGLGALKLAYQTETGLQKLDQHGRSVGGKSSVIIHASRKLLAATDKEP